MDGEQRIWLFPTVSWQWIDADRIQLKVPNGNDLTFTRYAKEIEKILIRVLTPPTITELSSWASSENISAELLDSVLDALEDSAVLVKTTQEIKNKGIFLNLLNYRGVSNDTLKQQIPIPFFDGMVVKGSGVTHDAVQNILLKDEFKANSNTQAKRLLTIYCCDNEDFSALREQNENSVNDRSLTLYVRWTGAYLAIGPLYIPDETPCFECYIVRRRASSEHIPEYDAALQQTSTGVNAVNNDAIFENAVQYFVGRYILIAQKGLFYLLNPSQVEYWDIVTAEKTTGEVLKVPRCDVCGRLRSRDPLQAVRELVN